MGLNISTDEKGVKIFKKEHDGQNGKWYTYSMKVASKSGEDWVNGYIDCVFRKGVSVNNKAVIKIKSAFPTVSKYQDKVYIKWMIMEFDVIDDGEAETGATNNGGGDLPDFMNFGGNIDDECPFN